MTKSHERNALVTAHVELNTALGKGIQQYKANLEYSNSHDVCRCIERFVDALYETAGGRDELQRRATLQEGHGGPVRAVGGCRDVQGGEHGGDGGGPIQGLGDIPPAWPDLPDNASLAVEVGWVQANRLRIVTEQAAGATIVDLDRAGSPAPSWATLGWLETSIRSYAKYVDVAAKATAVIDGEAGVWRHERMAIEEVRALLEEMREAEEVGTCPHCGKTI